ncbi:MAG: isoprenylcysteine carboxylmethyltransferase family protein, partial [Candidatus Eremiobacteraeota bacterium]|nr:isoprenylcysteine carboxylmethyltransferase family protein [Candidatus Eremiobacteraeota bacterium]
RGALLAIPALALVTLGRPTSRSIWRGLPLAILGELLRCWAVGYSGTTTRSDRVEAPQLVTAGPYAHIRNPLYLGNTITALGFAIAFAGKSRSRRTGFMLTTLASMVTVYGFVVRHEERFLADRFGDAYADYCTRVPAFGWRLKPAPFARGTYDGSVIAAAESRTFVTFAAMLAALVLRRRD